MQKDKKNLANLFFNFSERPFAKQFQQPIKEKELKKNRLKRLYKQYGATLNCQVLECGHTYMIPKVFEETETKTETETCLLCTRLKNDLSSSSKQKVLWIKRAANCNG